MLELNNIFKTFGGQTILNNVSLNIPRGARFGLIGGNATGKSTLINIVTGFLKVEKGSILLDKIDLTNLKSWKFSKLGIKRTFQNCRMQPDALLGDQLKFFKGSERALENMIISSGLSSHLNKFPSQIPLPLIRKAEVVRALICKPKFLFLDEPSAGLSEEELEQFATFLINYVPFDTGLLIVEHREMLMSRITEKVFLLNNGQIELVKKAIC